MQSQLDALGRAVELRPCGGRGGEVRTKPSSSAPQFSNGYRYVDWTTTVPILTIGHGLLVHRALKLRSAQDVRDGTLDLLQHTGPNSWKRSRW